MLCYGYRQGGDLMDPWFCQLLDCTVAVRFADAEPQAITASVGVLKLTLSNGSSATGVDYMLTMCLL